MRRLRFAHADRRARGSGFTLIELMLMLSLMILMIGMSIPAMDSFLKDTGPEAGARVVRGCLFAAKMKAIRERAYVQFDARPVGGLVSFKVAAGSGGQQIKADGVQWRVGAFTSQFLWFRNASRQGIIAAITSSDKNSVTIKSVGSTPSVGQTAYVVDDSDIKQFCASPDVESERWELLPTWVELEACARDDVGYSCLPIAFKPDGSLGWVKSKESNHRVPATVVIEVSDLRGTEAGRPWYVLVRRNTGAIQTIGPDSGTEYQTLLKFFSRG